jgi:hypothetical protein
MSGPVVLDLQPGIVMNLTLFGIYLQHGGGHGAASFRDHASGISPLFPHPQSFPWFCTSFGYMMQIGHIASIFQAYCIPPVTFVSIALFSPPQVANRRHAQRCRNHWMIQSDVILSTANNA